MDDISRLHDLRARIAELESGEFDTTDRNDEVNTPETLTIFRKSAAAIEAAWPDERLLREYCGSDADAGDPRQDALAAEIEKRGLDV